MSTQNVVNKSSDVGSQKHTNVNYEEVEGIKLRDSLFIVYPAESTYPQPEFLYNLMPEDGSREMIFDYRAVSLISTGGPENCGVYTLEDGRVLKINSMNNWLYNGYIFQDEDKWSQHKDFSDQE